MATSWEGGDPTKQKLILVGNKVIVERIGVYDGSLDPAVTYTKEVIYHFDTEDKAAEYYYKKR